MDNEIVELHPPLVTFASIEYDGDPLPPVQTNPPPPAPYDHKNNNLVVVNRNDLESILVSKAERMNSMNSSAASLAAIAQNSKMRNYSGVSLAQSKFDLKLT